MRWLIPFLSLFAVLGARAEEVAKLADGAIAWEKTIGPARVTGVSFSSKEATFRVLDNPPAARASLETALKSAGAIAGVNGGYFHEDFTPLGLVISAGKTIHEFQTAKLLSGLLIVRDGRLELVRSGSFKNSPSVTEALQSGPWLLEKGVTITGLNALRPARRTIIATDGAGHWALIVTSSITLAEAGELMKTPELCGAWNVKDALNLDGGSSTSLVAFADGRAVLDIPSFGSVRNYLAIVPRRK